MDVPELRKNGGASASVPCPDCHGAGKVTLLVSVKPCARCRGTGQLDPVLDAVLEEEDLSVRARSVLRRLGINTFRDLTGRTVADLLTVRGSGPTVVREIEGLLLLHGLSLRRSS